MIPLRLSEVADACGGLVAGTDPDTLVLSVTNDSRAVGPGALFVALVGERHDGHAFAADAAARGAVATLGSHGDGAMVRVDDPLRALAALAETVRARSTATVIAITGSSGKTGTKDLIAAACASERITVASPSSYNNEIGVPLTILAADETTEVLVVEVGSRGIGHIASLAPVIRPDIAVVTNVGPAHVGMFGSIENTARAKGELVEALGSDGVAVLNDDDPFVRDMGTRTKAKTVTFGFSHDADVRAEDVLFDETARASFTLTVGEDRIPVSLRTPGEHMIANALAAAAAASSAGISLDGVAQGLSVYEGAAWRMQMSDRDGVRIVNDAYNANPDSMAAALKTLAAMAHGRPTWAVLGYMAELGDSAVEAHDRIGRLAVRLGITHLVTVGADARAIHEAARLEGMFGGEAFFTADADAAVDYVRTHCEPDAIILVKASRAAGFERIARSLEEPRA